MSGLKSVAAKATTATMVPTPLLIPVLSFLHPPKCGHMTLKDHIDEITSL